MKFPILCDHLAGNIKYRISKWCLHTEAQDCSHSFCSNPLCLHWYALHTEGFCNGQSLDKCNYWIVRVFLISVSWKSPSILVPIYSRGIDPVNIISSWSSHIILVQTNGKNWAEINFRVEAFIHIWESKALKVKIMYRKIVFEHKLLIFLS